MPVTLEIAHKIHHSQRGHSASEDLQSAHLSYSVKSDSNLPVSEPSGRKKADTNDARQPDLLTNKTYFGTNHLDFYGLAPPNIGILTSNPSAPSYEGRVYRFVQSAYFGLKQSSLSDRGLATPHEALITMHPSEILAYLCAVNRLKFDGGLKHPNGMVKDIGLVTIDDIINVTEGVIEKAMSERHGFPGFRKMYHDRNAEIHQASLGERLAGLPSEILLEAISPVRRPYRHIHDPHPENIPSWTGANIYRNQIGYAMMAAWTKNMNTIRAPIFIRL